MFQWIRKKGKETADFGKKISNAEEIKKNADNIKEMAQVLLTPKDRLKNAKQETFVDARKRLNLSDVDLIRNYKNNSYCFYISLFFGFLCFAGAIYHLFVLKQIISSLGMISILMVCLANGFRFSFRAFQIKHQKLCSAKEWWDSSNEWFPKI